MRCVGDETDCTVEAGKGIEESRAKSLGGRGCGVFVEDEDGVFVPVEELPVDFEFGEGAGCAFCGFGAVVFFDELQVDIGGGAIGVIEFAAVDAEGLEGLVEVGFGELGLQELGELGQVESLGCRYAL
jgi:hypothetical protein